MNQSKILLTFSFLILVSIWSCKDDTVLPTKSANELIVVTGMDPIINENPSNKQLLTTITGTSALGDVVMSLEMESVTGSLDFNPENGEVRVKNRSLFDFEKNQFITFKIKGTVGEEWNEGTFKITLKDVEELPSVQNLLDEGKHPWEIMKSNSKYTIDSLINKRYGGGYIFRVDDFDFETWIVAKEDIGSAPWGCKGTLISYTSDAIHKSAENTKTILAECNEPSIAARKSDAYSIDGYDDWYLPSEGEMRTVFFILKKETLDKMEIAIGSKYWTSTQENKDDAIYIGYISEGRGTSYTGSKDILYKVRPCRKVTQ